jgi:hypothetical protein
MLFAAISLDMKVIKVEIQQMKDTEKCVSIEERRND